MLPFRLMFLDLLVLRPWAVGDHADGSRGPRRGRRGSLLFLELLNPCAELRNHLGLVISSRQPLDPEASMCAWYRRLTVLDPSRRVHDLAGALALWLPDLSRYPDLVVRRAAPIGTAFEAALLRLPAEKSGM